MLNAQKHRDTKNVKFGKESIQQSVPHFCKLPTTNQCFNNVHHHSLKRKTSRIFTKAKIRLSSKKRETNPKKWDWAEGRKEGTMGLPAFTNGRRQGKREDPFKSKTAVRSERRDKGCSHKTLEEIDLSGPRKPGAAAYAQR